VVNGQIRGVWEYEEKRGKTHVVVQLFSPQPAHIKAQIEAEAQQLGTFLETSVEVRIA
jgi:hypothetical protein